MSEDPRLSELRLVEWTLVGSSEPRREWVLASEVDRFCEAIRALHLDPGVNPHSGNPAARLLTLSVASGTLESGFWWSTPSLDEKDGPAQLVRWRHELRYEDEPEADPPDPV